MCMGAPKQPSIPPPLPPIPPPIAPPPAAAAAQTVTQASAGEASPSTARKAKNPLRTDQGGADSVASGLNIPV